MEEAQKVEAQQESAEVVMEQGIINKAKGSAGWVIAFGVLEMIAGIAAFAYPLMFGEALATIVGFVLIFAGVAQFFGLIRAGSGRIGVSFFIAVVYLLVGLVLVLNPLSAVSFLTLILGVFFIFEGIGRLLAAYEIKRHKVLFFINGVATLVLGFIILSGWPRGTDWILGLLIGINLFISGIATVRLGSALNDAEAV